MKRIIGILLGFLFLTLSVYADDSDLDIRVETMRERQSTYTSIADLYELDILTPESAEREKEYELWREAERRSLLGSLALTGTDEGKDSALIIEERALELGLFLRAKEETYFRPDRQFNVEEIPPLLAAGIIVLLCVGGFLLSNSLYKRKKRRTPAHVHDRHPAHA
jgi:hypothetical protein